MVLLSEQIDIVFSNQFLVVAKPLLAFICGAQASQINANSQQPTANSQQPTANSQQPTANSQLLFSL